MTEELHRLSACAAVRGLREGTLDPEALVRAACARMDLLDPELNAVPTKLFERAIAACGRVRALRDAKAADPQWLGGLPVVIKDIHHVAGVRTTFGSKAFSDFVPQASSWHVERLERRGAIVIGKSNTPEFAAGAQTFNEVHGITRNPWNPALTCGGSSGGSAVAVATGMAWLADGSDLGGSLRIPAAFCGVVGLRPSIGRVPLGPQPLPFQTLNVVGPIARNVRDVALMLDVLSGADARDPLALPAPDAPFLHQVDADCDVRRIGFDPDLGGRMEVHTEIARVLEGAMARVAASGIAIDPVSVATEDSIAAFRVLRALHLAAELSEIAAANPGVLKRELEANIEQGLQLQGAQVAAADRARGRAFGRLMHLLSTHPIVALPTVVLPPFDVNLRFPDRLNEQRFENYFDWAATTFVISLTGCPALSLPCGFTAQGLPVGLQLVAAPRDEGRLLNLAARLEAALDVRPPLAFMSARIA